MKLIKIPITVELLSQLEKGGGLGFCIFSIFSGEDAFCVIVSGNPEAGGLTLENNSITVIICETLL